MSDLPARLERLIEKWRASRAHTYASENADHYRGFDDGLSRCADELAAALVGVEPPLDTENLRNVLCWVSQIFNGWRSCEEWSQFDEETAQAVVAIQRAIDVPVSAPKEKA